MNAKDFIVKNGFTGLGIFGIMWLVHQFEQRAGIVAWNIGGEIEMVALLIFVMNLIILGAVAKFMTKTAKN